MVSDAVGQRAFEWAFLFWGSNWEAARSEVWAWYVDAATARNDGERDEFAETQLHAIMRRLVTSENMKRTARAIKRTQAIRQRYEPLVLPLRARPTPTPAWALDAWCRCELQVQRLSKHMHELVVQP